MADEIQSLTQHWKQIGMGIAAFFVGAAGVFGFKARLGADEDEIDRRATEKARILVPDFRLVIERGGDISIGA